MVVLDTSVIFKWFDLKEDNRTQATRILKRHLEGTLQILTYDLLLYELTNAWVTKSKLLFLRIRTYLQNFLKYNIPIVPFNIKRIENAMLLARKFNVSVYDATFAALAQEHGCKLVTADTDFLRHLQASYIVHLRDFV